MTRQSHGTSAIVSAFVGVFKNLGEVVRIQDTQSRYAHWQKGLREAGKVNMKALILSSTLECKAVGFTEAEMTPMYDYLYWAWEGQIAKIHPRPDVTAEEIETVRGYAHIMFSGRYTLEQLANGDVPEQVLTTYPTPGSQDWYMADLFRLLDKDRLRQQMDDEIIELIRDCPRCNGQCGISAMTYYLSELTVAAEFYKSGTQITPQLRDENHDSYEELFAGKREAVKNGTLVKASPASVATVLGPLTDLTPAKRRPRLSKDQQRRLCLEAMSMLMAKPRPTKAEICERLNVPRSTLDENYAFQPFRAMWEMQQEADDDTPPHSIPRGTKGKDGTIEATDFDGRR